MTPGAPIPPQRRSGYLQRAALARGLERAAREAEMQDPGHSRAAPVLAHLARLVALPPGRTDEDWARISAAFFDEPSEPEPITGGFRVDGARR